MQGCESSSFPVLSLWHFCLASDTRNGDLLSTFYPYGIWLALEVPHGCKRKSLPRFSTARLIIKASFTTRVNSRYTVVSRGFLKLVLLGFLGINVLATMLLTQASLTNYPGGEALRMFNHIIEHGDSRGENCAGVSCCVANRTSEVSVHIDNHAAQTGASLFLHEHAPPYDYLVLPHDRWRVVYNKTENLVTMQEFEGFDWVITEHPDMFTRPDGKTRSRWKVQASAAGLRRVELASLGGQGVWKHLKFPRVVRETKIWILEQKNQPST